MESGGAGEREGGRVEGESGVIYSRSCWRYQTWFGHFTDIVENLEGETAAVGQEGKSLEVEE